MNCTIYIAQTKALISSAVTAKLICVFVFTYAKRWFSRDAATECKVRFTRGTCNIRPREAYATDWSKAMILVLLLVTLYYVFCVLVCSYCVLLLCLNSIFIAVY